MSNSSKCFKQSSIFCCQLVLQVPHIILVVVTQQRAVWRAPASALSTKYSNGWQTTLALASFGCMAWRALENHQSHKVSQISAPKKNLWALVSSSLKEMWIAAHPRLSSQPSPINFVQRPNRSNMGSGRRWRKILPSLIPRKYIAF